jgi:hypothetical protein
MATPTFIGAYWYSRPQTLGQCTSQLLAFLQKLQQHNALVYSHWFEQANTKAKALTKPLGQDYAGVLNAFGTKTGEQSYPETTFGLGLWNGARRDAEGIVLRVSLGGSEPSLYSNYCLLDLQQNKECQVFYANKQNVEAFENLFFDFWQPEKIILQ